MKYLISLLYLLCYSQVFGQFDDGYLMSLKTQEKVECQYVKFKNPIIVKEIIDSSDEIDLSTISGTFQAILSSQNKEWYEKYIYKWSDEIAVKYSNIYGTRNRKEIEGNYFEIEQKVEFEFKNSLYSVIKFQLFVADTGEKYPGSYVFINVNSNWMKVIDTQFSEIGYCLLMMNPEYLSVFLSNTTTTTNSDNEIFSSAKKNGLVNFNKLSRKINDWNNNNPEFYEKIKSK